MNLSPIISVLIVLNYLSISNSAAIDFELELLQVLFRHGDRTPEKGEVYKTDPYDPDYYQPIGYGQLMRSGKEREYKFGQMLRERYDKFLGDFNNDEVYAYSTDFDRTKMSLHLALAGLYPPTQKTSWSKDIYWSPIPTYYEKTSTDFLYIDMIGPCFNYGKFIYDAERSPEIQKRMEKYGDFPEYVTNKTGIPRAGPFRLFLLYNNLLSVRSMGLPLPSWCSEEDFNIIEEITEIAYEVMAYTEHAKKIAIGLTIEKFIENMNSADERKIYMYSAHDITVSAFTRAHNFTEAPKIPSFGSAVVVEKLRGSDDQIYLRMFAWTGDTEQMIPLKLDNCNNECLLKDYESIIKSMILSDSDKQCFSKIHTELYPRPINEDPYKLFSDFKYSQ